MAHERKLALVTGASSGIGTDFSRGLAARGYDLIISARRRELLDELKTELQEHFNIDVQIVTADLSQPNGPTELFQAAQQLSRPVTFLANNAGLGRFGEFTAQSLD